MHRPRTQCTIHHFTASCLRSLYTPLYLVVDIELSPSLTPSPSSLSLSLVLPRSPSFGASVTFGTPRTGLRSPFGRAVSHLGPFLIVSTGAHREGLLGQSDGYPLHNCAQKNIGHTPVSLGICSEPRATPSTLPALPLPRDHTPPTIPSLYHPRSLHCSSLHHQAPNTLTQHQPNNNCTFLLPPIQLRLINSFVPEFPCPIHFAFHQNSSLRFGLPIAS